MFSLISVSLSAPVLRAAGLVDVVSRAEELIAWVSSVVCTLILGIPRRRHRMRQILLLVLSVALFVRLRAVEAIERGRFGIVIITLLLLRGIVLVCLCWFRLEIGRW